MMPMDRLDVFELLDLADACRVPDALRARSGEIAREAAWYHDRIRDGHVPVYGATTLTGHLDDVRVSVEAAVALQHRIIDSHCIGARPFQPPATARLVGYAKACAVAAGGSGLSAGIYEHLLDALCDPAFAPEIPVSASYSCGDVIPGAHWARALLEHGGFSGRHGLLPGDALALINGSFVDLGTTLALVPALRDALVACSANAAGVARAWEHADGGGGTQAAVSVRATPQLMATLMLAATTLVRVLGEELATPSANPLVSMQAGRIESQASFMSPRLAVAKSALAEAVLFASWACQGRIGAVVQRLEAGEVPGIDALDVVQVPKLTQAWLEESRLRLGRRLFASGAQTSRGIEDLWSFGTLASAQLEDGIAAWARMEATLSLLLQALEARSREAATLVLARLRGGDAPTTTAPGDDSLHRTITNALRDG